MNTADLLTEAGLARVKVWLSDRWGGAPKSAPDDVHAGDQTGED